MSKFRILLSCQLTRFPQAFAAISRQSLQAAFHKLHILMLLSLTVLLFAFGCQSYKILLPKTAEHYYLNPNKDLSCIGRVALVELDNNSSYPKVSVDITESLFKELQKKQFFGIIIFGQSNPAWRNLQLNLNDTYALDQLLTIRETSKCNAVLTGIITEFKPYPHMVIGLRLKLVDLRDGELIWALEQIWDTADKTTEKRIKKYFQSQLRAGYAPLHEQLAIISSFNFIKFVTYEVAATL